MTRKSRMASCDDQTRRFADNSREWLARKHYQGIEAELLEAFRLVRPVLERMAAEDPQSRALVARTFQLMEQIERAIRLG